jgi:hypothetical protein
MHMKPLSPIALIVGILVVAGFAWLCIHMVGQSTRIDNQGQQYQWDRLVLVFNAVQAMAAAALGAILGVTVQQARVEAAEQKAAANSEDAAKAKAARHMFQGLQPPGAADTQGQKTELEARLEALRAVLN